jgi:hypothetical protein
MRFLSSSPDSVAAKIFDDVFGFPQVAEWKAEMDVEAATFVRDAANLFAEITKKLGPSKAREIFTAAMTGGRGKRKTEENLDIDRALAIHCIFTQSPRKTAKRAIALGLKGSLDTIETRVKRTVRAMRESTAKASTGDN